MINIHFLDMKMDQVDTLRSSRVSFDAKEGARHSKDGWFTGTHSYVSFVCAIVMFVENLHVPSRTFT